MNCIAIIRDEHNRWNILHTGIHWCDDLFLVAAIATFEMIQDETISHLFVMRQLTPRDAVRFVGVILGVAGNTIGMRASISTLEAEHLLMVLQE